MESAELLKKLSAYMQGCEDKCIDLRTLTFDAKNGETGLSRGLLGVSAFFLLSLGVSLWRARKWQKGR